jgi:hypothetical protein
MSDAELFIRCDCHSPEHMLIFDAWHWDTDKCPHSELSVHLGLEKYLPWWKRLWLAARYAATGRTERYWWAETVINDRNAAALRDYLNEYLEASLNKLRAVK